MVQHFQCFLQVRTVFVKLTTLVMTATLFLKVRGRALILHLLLTTAHLRCIYKLLKVVIVDEKQEGITYQYLWGKKVTLQPSCLRVQLQSECKVISP